MEPELKEATPEADTVEPKEPEVEIPTYTAEEEHAMKYGWKPKDQYEGPEGNWRSAREFNERADFIGQLKTQNKEINTLKQSLNQVIKTERKRADRFIQEEIERLSKEKEDAYANEDFKRVVQLDDEIAERKQEAKNTNNLTELNINDRAGNVEANNAWMNANSTWYRIDEDLTVEADDHYLRYMNSYPDKTVTDALAYVDRKMKTKLSKSNNTDIPDTQMSDTSTPQRKKTGKFTVNDLSAQQKQIMRGYVESGILSEQDYIDELVNLGELTK